MHSLVPRGIHLGRPRLLLLLTLSHIVNCLHYKDILKEYWRARTKKIKFPGHLNCTLTGEMCRWRFYICLFDMHYYCITHNNLHACLKKNIWYFLFYYWARFAFYLSYVMFALLFLHKKKDLNFYYGIHLNFFFFFYKISLVKTEWYS